MQLKNKNIFITGSSRGIGLAIAHKFAQAGANIVLNSRGAISEELLAEFSNYGVKVVPISGDVSDFADAKRMVDQAIAELGSVDVLVNNAGYGIFEAFDSISDQQVQEMFEVNTFALMQLSRLMGAHMKAAGKGHIVNIVSMAGLVATAKSSLYSATKFAAIGFSNALRLELMPFGVHVTTVNPGPIRTSFFDQADPDGSYVKAVDRYILEPDFVAKKIVKNFGKAKRELNLPWLLNLTHKLYTLFPRISDKLASKMFNFK